MAFCGKENRDYAHVFTMQPILLSMYMENEFLGLFFLCAFTYVNTGLNVKLPELNILI